MLGYFPYWIAASDNALFDPGFIRYLAFPLWLIGAVVMLRCFWDFTVTGHGTPAPIDPPKDLVITGLYRFVRNPMYVGGTIILLGWLIWSPSPSLISAPLFFFTAFHLFVLFYEEPTLRRKFGSAYEDYLHKVPRWIPRFRR